MATRLTSNERHTRSHAPHLKLAGGALALLMPVTAINVAAEQAGPADGGAPLSEHQRDVLDKAGPSAGDAGSSSATDGVESGVNDGGAPLTPHQLQTLKGIDMDGDERLSQTEYSAYQETSGTQRGFGEVDSDLDGYVNPEEFSALQAAIAREKEKTQLQ